MSEEDKNKLIEFLKRESNNEYTEFRIFMYHDGKCYAHVLGRNSETIDFALDSTPDVPPGQTPPGGK
jgi:hypothetical protein